MLAVHRLVEQLGGSVVVADLSKLTVGQYDYDCHDDRDDFRAVIGLMLAAEHIVFATPVYWYAMSGVMKVFFDRLTDLLADPNDRKTGRALVGRNVWLLATGTDEELPGGFEEPFARTAAYLGMVWRQSCYCRVHRETSFPQDVLSRIDELAEKIALAG